MEGWELGKNQGNGGSFQFLVHEITQTLNLNEHSLICELVWVCEVHANVLPTINTF